MYLYVSISDARLASCRRLAQWYESLFRRRPVFRDRIPAADEMTMTWGQKRQTQSGRATRIHLLLDIPALKSREIWHGDSGSRPSHFTL
jgi:hypothetical protein